MMKLSWFRKYSKHLMVVFGGMLMVFFLLEGTLNHFMGTPEEQPVGYIGDREVTFLDQRQAQFEMRVIETFAPMLSESQAEDAPLRWILMKHEAQQLGLSASEMYEVDAFLRTLGYEEPEQELQRVAQQMRVTSSAVRQALQTWLMLAHYRELTYSMGHLTVPERLAAYQSFYQALQMNYPPMIAMAYQGTLGQPRVSDALLKRFIYDQQSTVEVASVIVPSGQFIDRVDEPSEERLQELFEQYKDELPGQSEPYGIGYKYPERVKLEYLAIPIESVEQSIQVSEADLFEYYDANKSQFRTQTENGPGAVKPYGEVRDRIMVELKEQRAEQLAQRMIREARARLETRDVANLPTVGGYKDTTVDEYQPTPLRQIAETLQGNYDILPEVQRYDDAYLELQDVATLPGIGQSFVLGQPQAVMPFYVQSARELLEADEEHPLLAARLQVGVPSEIMVGRDGSRYLFRLTEALPAREPDSLDEVREQVVRDAKRLAAYDMLKNQQQDWITQARERGLDYMADETGRPVLRPRPFRRREMTMQGTTAAPNLQGIGQSESFVSGVFNFATDLAVENDQPISELPASERTTAVPVDSQMALALTRIESFEPVSRTEYESMATGPYLPLQAMLVLMSNAPIEEQAAIDDPLSVESLKARTGFESSSDGEEETEGEGENATEEATPDAA